ncbi:hypothetical protein [Nitrosopumilus sp. S6]
MKFKFKNEKKPNVALLTYEQYSNIKDLPITVECKIVKNEKTTLSKSDVEALNKKLQDTFSKSKSHTDKLSEN